MKVAVGLDIGTTSVSCVAVAENGQQLATVTAAHDAALKSLSAGHVEQDPAELWNVAAECLSQCVGALRDPVAGIGVTGQMHSTVLLDSASQPLSPVITWQDQRASVGNPSHLHELLAELDSEQMEGTGCRLSPGFMGTTLYSLGRSNSLPAGLQSVSFVADWIVAQLTGTDPVTDRTHAASSGLYDLRADCWSESLLLHAGVNDNWLPQVRPTGEIAGNLQDGILLYGGDGHKIPVCTAIGDHQAAVLSTLSGEDTGSLLINIGTGGQVCWRAPAFLLREGLEVRSLPAEDLSQPGEFIQVGAGLCGGAEFSWLAETLERLSADLGSPVSRASIWKQLTGYTALADTGLTCEPYFFGTRPEPHRRGLLSQIDSSNLTVHGIASAVARGIADSMRELSIAEEAEPKQVCMSGNASRSIPLLRLAVEESFGLPVRVVAVKEEAATGAALLAGTAVGLWPGLSAARTSLESRNNRETPDD